MSRFSQPHTPRCEILSYPRNSKTETKGFEIYRITLPNSVKNVNLKSHLLRAVVIQQNFLKPQINISHSTLKTIYASKTNKRKEFSQKTNSRPPSGNYKAYTKITINPLNITQPKGNNEMMHKSTTMVSLKKSPYLASPISINCCVLAINEILKTVKSRSEDIKSLFSLVENTMDMQFPEFREDDNLVTKVEHKEILRLRTEEKIITQLQPEKIHETEIRKYFFLYDFNRNLIKSFKKTIKLFENKAISQEINSHNIEIQLKLIMGDIQPSNIPEKFTYSESLHKILSYSFKESSLDINFICQMLIMFSRGELQKAQKKAANFLGSYFTCGVKRQLFARKLLGSMNNNKDYIAKYINLGKNKIFNLMMANNLQAKIGIKDYYEKYNERRGNNNNL